jgi:hypothetical protein
MHPIGRLPISLVAAVAAASLTGAGAATRNHTASVQGVWRTAEVTLTGPGARTISHLQPSLAIFTAKHYSRVEIHEERPRPVVPDVMAASADELRAVWRPFVAEAGTYELSGDDGLTMHPMVAKNPAAMTPGSSTTYSYRLKGDTLWVTQRRDHRGPIANPATIRLERVE